MANGNKTIGVLGGMGPGASANLYSEIIKYSQHEYNAVQDRDYPPIIIYSLPLEGFNETGIVDETLVEGQLIEGVKKLESAGCDLIIIGCNTVHVLYDQMQSAIKIPILNIVEETKSKVLEAGYKRVGLFASESTIKSGLYQDRFKESGIEAISPNGNQQKTLNRVVSHVMAGKQDQNDTEALKDIAQNYIRQGAEAVVMGCTEIPLAIKQSDTNIKLFNTVEIIVQSAVDFSLKK